MGLPPLTGCCCCCGLKTGVTVLAVLSIIGSIVNAAQWLSGSESRKLTDNLNKLGGYEPSTIDNMIMGMFVISVIFDVVQLVVSSLLLHGVRKDNPKAMKPYLVWGAIGIVYMIIMGIVIIAMFSGNPVFVTTYLISIVLILLIQLYFLWVVHSYIKSVSGGDRAGTMKMEEGY